MKLEVRLKISVVGKDKTVDSFFKRKFCPRFEKRKAKS